VMASPDHLFDPIGFKAPAPKTGELAELNELARLERERTLVYGPDGQFARQVCLHSLDKAHYAHYYADIVGTAMKRAYPGLVEGLPSSSYWEFHYGQRHPVSASAAATTVDDIGLAAFAQESIPTQRSIPPPSGAGSPAGGSLPYKSAAICRVPALKASDAHRG
jgi:hypothetical protein